MKFYRYETEQTSSFAGFAITELRVKEFNLHKETPKGYWIGWGHYYSKYSSRWVSKDGLKRYAYPTKEEARINYIKRTEKHIKILKNRLNAAETGLRIAIEKKETEKNLELKK